MSVLEFDSEWFGVTIGRYDGDPNEADTWAKDNHVGCVYCLLPVEKIGMVYDATKKGFRLTDVRVEFAAKTSLVIPPDVREAEGPDAATVQDIAVRSYQKTRFHNDRNFDRDRVNQMYANWVLTSKGFTFVVEGDEGIAGFVLVGETHLELIAVDQAHRGQGHGGSLARAAIGHAYAKGRPEIRVVTQSGNHAAQRTFQAAGFRLVDTSLWLHKWYQ